MPTEMILFGCRVRSTHIRNSTTRNVMQVSYLVALWRAGASPWNAAVAMSRPHFGPASAATTDDGFPRRVRRSSGHRARLRAQPDCYLECRRGLGAKAGLSGLNGRIGVIGTPAEEGGGGKIHLIEVGVFAEVDVALSSHPSGNLTLIPTDSANPITGLAMIGFRYAYHGKSAHAAVAPHEKA